MRTKRRLFLTYKEFISNRCKKPKGNVHYSVERKKKLLVALNKYLDISETKQALEVIEMPEKRKRRSRKNPESVKRIKNCQSELEKMQMEDQMASLQEANWKKKKGGDTSSNFTNKNAIDLNKVIKVNKNNANSRTKTKSFNPLVINPILENAILMNQFALPLMSYIDPEVVKLKGQASDPICLD